MNINMYNFNIEMKCIFLCKESTEINKYFIRLCKYMLHNSYVTEICRAVHFYY
jgi:transcription initiation factor IIF auxiliary subunit